MARRLSENGFHVGDWLVEPGLNRVSSDENVVTLEPKTMNVLVYLAARAGEVVSAEEILTELWPDTMVNDGSIYWYIARLRKAFGDNPKNQQTIRTVPKKGYQLVAPVLDRPVAEITNELGTVATLLADSTDEDEPGAEQLAERRPIAVLPFLNLGQEDELFCEGLTVELQNVLAHVRGLRVAGLNSSFAFKERRLDLRMIGRLLGVGHVVEGTVRRDGNHVRVTAELVDTRDGMQLWSSVYQREIKDAFELQQDIALDVADALKVTLLPGDESRIAARYTRDRTAWEFFLLGRHEWQTRSGKGSGHAIRWYEKAIERDPSFALAQAGLACSHAVLPWYARTDPVKCAERAKAAGSKALELAPDLAEAHAVFGLIHTDFEFDGEAAENWYRRSLEIKPSCAEARHWYGDLLNAMGRHEDALKQAVLALQLEPLSALHQLRVARILDDGGRESEASEAFKRALEMDPPDPAIHTLNALHFLRIGDLSRGTRRLERWADIDPLVDPDLARTVEAALCDGSDRESAVAMIKSLDGNLGILPLVKTALLLLVGADAGATDVFFQTASTKHPCLPWLLVMPCSGPLWRDSRVTDFVAQSGLPSPGQYQSPG